MIPRDGDTLMLGVGTEGTEGLGVGTEGLGGDDGRNVLLRLGLREKLLLREDDEPREDGMISIYRGVSFLYPE